MEALLNSRTSALCFNKEDFVVKDFTVDKFVSNCRKYVSLESMGDDLSLYHKILCSSMVELINNDYAHFIDLISNLVGLDKSIQNLCFPLEKLRSDVESLKNNLNGNLNYAKSTFFKYSSEHKRKVLAERFLLVLDGVKKLEHLHATLLISPTEIEVPSEKLEKIALDLIIIQFHIQKISSKEIEHKKVVLQKIICSLSEHLEYLFLQSHCENNLQNLCKILRIFAIIDKKKEIEKYFCECVVKPYMKKHITDENILNHGISYVFDKVLKFIPNFCAAVLRATCTSSKRFSDVVSGYDFLVNAVWPEIVRSFQLIAPVHIYAPGDPQLFHKNYTCCILFLNEFEEYFDTETSIYRFRKSNDYKLFMEKWNLDVYFEIRFQEIAGNFEASIPVTPANIKGKSDKYHLNVSCSLLECIKLCWSDHVFLSSLTFSFFRLTCQLISRYHKWACMFLKSQENEASFSPVEVAMVMKDAESLISELELIFREKISIKIPIYREEEREKVLCKTENAFQEAINLLTNIIPIANSLFIQILRKQCCSHLKLITDIPRLYRKTNRTIPSKPSGYVALIFDSLNKFISTTDSILSEKEKQNCVEQVTDGIIKECFIMIQDVLNSIKKMEDSLKILKRARDKPTLGQTTSGSICSDDDKIRRQLVIDVNSIEERVINLGLVEVNNMKNMKELKKLVNSTEKNVT